MSNTNEYKEILKKHLSKIMLVNGLFDSKRFQRYIDAIMKMEKNMLINESNRGQINIKEPKNAN